MISTLSAVVAMLVLWSSSVNSQALCDVQARNSLSGGCRSALIGVSSANPSDSDLETFCDSNCLRDYHCELTECTNNTQASQQIRLWCARDASDRRCRTVRLDSSLLTNVTRDCEGVNCTNSACNTAINEYGCCIQSFGDRFPFEGCGLSACSVRDLTCAGTTLLPSLTMAIISTIIVALMILAYN